MKISDFKKIAILMIGVSITGCSATTFSKNTVTQTKIQPMTASAVRIQPQPVQQPLQQIPLQGMDFTQAVAMIAQTPGTGVTQIRGQTTALAYAPTSAAKTTTPSAKRNSPSAKRNNTATRTNNTSKPATAPTAKETPTPVVASTQPTVRRF